MQSKIDNSLKIIEKVFQRYKPHEVYIAWTGGKDSTVILDLVRKYFKGTIPCRVFFNDSTMEFDEVYEFVENIKNDWGLDLIIVKHSSGDLRKYEELSDYEEQRSFSRVMKINSIKRAIKKYSIKVFLSGVRWDEDPARESEKYFVTEENHRRVHPILHFKEDDIWEYINKHKVPYVNLYNKGYRSLGEKPFTRKVSSGGLERDGREFGNNSKVELNNLRTKGHW